MTDTEHVATHDGTHLATLTIHNRTEATLPLVEQFGPTLQGEGPAAGRSAAFIRFGGCNLACAWCDSAYTWDGTRYDLREEITATTAETIVDELPPLHQAPLVILTGGEPLLHQDNPAWHDLLLLLANQGREVHVETNGTREPNTVTRVGVSVFNVSPKLPNAGTHRRSQDPTLHPGWTEWAHATDAHLKFVCADADDVGAGADMADAWGWPRRRTWAMPLGTTTTELAQRWPAIATAAAEHGINATHRLHVLAWGDERGR